MHAIHISILLLEIQVLYALRSSLFHTFLSPFSELAMSALRAIQRLRDLTPKKLAPSADAQHMLDAKAKEFEQKVLCILVVSSN
jgi:hypothetical protein